MTSTVDELEILAREAASGPGGGLSAAELHGAVIGIGVTDAEHFELQDLVDLLGADALSDGATVARFVNEALASLHTEDMSFALLLPEDDESRVERLAALAEWSQSFLAGFAAGLAHRGIETLRDLPAEVQEIVRDFSAIAEIDTEDEVGDEEDFMQLEEYVKVGALLIMSLTNDAGDDSEE